MKGLWANKEYIGEERRYLYIDCHHLLHQYLSLNVSTLLQDLKRKWKYKIKEKENPNLQLEERKPSLISNLLAFRVTAGLFIGKWRIWKTRRGHASKIDAWAHHFAAETRLLSRFRGHMVGPCVNFRRVASSRLLESPFAYKFGRVWSKRRQI